MSTLSYEERLAAELVAGSLARTAASPTDRAMHEAVAAYHRCHMQGSAHEGSGTGCALTGLTSPGEPEARIAA